MPGGSVSSALVVALLRLGLGSRSRWMRLGRSLRARWLRHGTRGPEWRRHAGSLDAGTTVLAAHAVEEPLDRPSVRITGRSARSIAWRLALWSILGTPLVSRLGTWLVARRLRPARRRWGKVPSPTLVAHGRRGPLARRSGLPSARPIGHTGDIARSHLRARSFPPRPGRAAARLHGLAGAPRAAARADRGSVRANGGTGLLQARALPPRDRPGAAATGRGTRASLRHPARLPPACPG